ncbi:alpha/beta fold hydrolase [Streptomyces sp. NPDC003691]
MSPTTDHRSAPPRPAGRARRRALAVSALVLAGLQTGTGLASAAPGDSGSRSAAPGNDRSRSTGPGLQWQLCATAAVNWPLKNDTRTECAELAVPLDHAKPQGRKITIAVSRVRATGGQATRPPIVAVLGGPGFSNITDSASMARRGLSSLNTDRDFIGLDLRGAGYSDHIACAEQPFAEPAPTAPEKAFKKAEFDQQAEFNNRCTAVDREFARQLTPENTARDIDRLRAALGAEKISFYGASFGTAVGLAYRSLFDRRTERVWLDSVMPPTRHWPTMDRETEAVGQEEGTPFVPWLAQRDAEYGMGADAATVRARLGELRGELDRKPRVAAGGVRVSGPWVLDQVVRPQEEWDDAAKNLVVVRDGGTPTAPAAPPAAATQPGAAAPGKAPLKPRSATAPATPPAAGAAPTAVRSAGLGKPRSGFNSLQYNAMLCNTTTASRGFGELWAARESRRKADPLQGGMHFTVWCANWPMSAPAARPGPGNSALQLSGHLYEGVTPYVWAEQARDAHGATLLTMLDSGHADLPESPCADKALTFFRTGRTADGTCGGPRS